MKFTLPLIALLLLSAALSAQTADTTSKKTLLCKYWHLAHYEGTDKNMYNATPDVMVNWIKYNTDGTFTDKETSGTYKGNWTFDEAAMTITLTQNKSKDYPAKMQLKVTRLTKSKLEARADDFSGNPAAMIYMESGIYKSRAVKPK